ncbi:hypothetical protein Pst134EA_003343 [Puccinia striiformis f. sp. tritici]|uniref:Hydrophobin n=2 Tax=Puccinia striiformis TaxID=27350 RepID=A0A0L0VR13_9BASI|nr:hypothetical protein Pst134EA_003343 [Puccinia striiformis f. sp. tritici]KAI9611521.1 hypothetical protein H4Q26_008475 [Puccinia striiformis f. sp. tritici PST-130]KNF01647.1 hypothetical protein PSTG_05079 [Puccinia striiformis f. sp. tritici PST-78]POW16328.1 hypothetical protein PSTT_01421 [Puccinia striiformis]KAH9464901.1 hypothetical protein Pst134EB_004406 [Puccinia striiformis f. sp. tritici]KAH9472735.1 hypothetical protein Pst134EA_003343 [Puccinia striiformis f. sp. tritici]
MLYLHLFLALFVSLGVSAQGFNPIPYAGFVCPAGRVTWCVGNIYQKQAPHYVVRATISEGPSPTRRYDCMNKSISTDACCSQQFNTANSATAVYSDIQRFCTDPNGNQFQ